MTAEERFDQIMEEKQREKTTEKEPEYKRGEERYFYCATPDCNGVEGRCWLCGGLWAECLCGDNDRDCSCGKRATRPDNKGGNREHSNDQT